MNTLKITLLTLICFLCTMVSKGQSEKETLGINLVKTLYTSKIEELMISNEKDLKNVKELDCIDLYKELSKTFTQELTVSDLKETLKFFSSPSGKALLDTNALNMASNIIKSFKEKRETERIEVQNKEMEHLAANINLKVINNSPDLGIIEEFPVDNPVDELLPEPIIEAFETPISPVVKKVKEN